MRVNALAQWTPSVSLPSLTVQYLDRRPNVGSDSYFVRFTEALERIRIARATTRYVTSRGIGGEVEFFGSYLDDRSATRIGVAVLGPHARVGYSARVGDSGEESRWYGDLHAKPMSWLSLQGGAAIATYALVEDAPSDEERDLTTAFARAQLELRPGLILTAELQSLDDPFFSKDIRFLAGLDLFAGGGAARYGLGTGRWLP